MLTLEYSKLFGIKSTTWYSIYHVEKDEEVLQINVDNKYVWQEPINRLVDYLVKQGELKNRTFLQFNMESNPEVYEFIYAVEAAFNRRIQHK
jgi:hypothetical protein